MDIIIDDIDSHFDKVKFRKIEQMMQMVEGEKENFSQRGTGKYGKVAMVSQHARQRRNSHAEKWQG